MGFVYFVGAGPGDPELITLKGINALREADAVLYDALASPELLSYAREDAVKIAVGKRAGAHSMAQEEINGELIRLAGEKNVVVRLKGGDSMVLGRGGEEASALDAAKIPYAFIPGVSSCTAVPELAGIPLTYRNISRAFTVITGHTSGGTLDEEELGRCAKLNSTLVILMGLSSIEKITGVLIKHGRSGETPAAVVSNGSVNGQRQVRGTLERIARLAKNADLKPPAVIVVGETAGFDFSKKITVGCCGSSRTKEKLRREMPFADCLDLLTLKFIPLPFDIPPLDSFDVISFSSVQAVRLFFENTGGFDFKNTAFAPIGRETAAELERSGCGVGVIGQEFSSKSLAREIIGRGFKNALVVRCKTGLDTLEKTLENNGVSCSVIFPYDTYIEKGADFEYAQSADYIAFTCPSCAREFFKLFPDIRNVRLAAIGSSTADEVRSHTSENVITGNEFTARGLARAILEDLI